MQLRTAMYIGTPEAAGSRRREVVRPLQRDGGSKKRRADRQPLAAEAEAGGNRGRRVRAAQQAVEADTSDGDKAYRTARNKSSGPRSLEITSRSRSFGETQCYSNRMKSLVRAGSLPFAVLLVLTACNKSGKSSARTFGTPEEAGSALQAAAKSGDEGALVEIFGPDSKKIISSGDPVQDKNTVRAFTEAYDVMHRWRTMADGAETLIVGADNFPFPIPLKKNSNSQWFFDTNAGKEEILNRRIGRNELAIIDVCNAVAEAQGEYFSQPRNGETRKQYAVKFISDPGKENGLYWESSAGQPESPLGPLVAFATTDGYSAKPGNEQQKEQIGQALRRCRVNAEGPLVKKPM